jgi:hypothetical protein
VERIVAVSGVGEGVGVVERAQWVNVSGSRWSRFGLLRDDSRPIPLTGVGEASVKAAIVECLLPKV